MELVGLAVRKCFLGLGSISGFVESYEPSAGFFQIRYEDGDSEEVDFDGIASILREMGHELPPAALFRRSSSSRRSKKRHHLDPGDIDVVSAEALGNGVSKGGGCSGQVAHTEETGRNAAHDADLMMGGSLVDHLEESTPPGGWFDIDDACMEEVLPDNFSSGENLDEDLGGERILFDTESKGEVSIRKRRKLSGKSTPDMPLRRSARRTSASLLSPQAVSCKTEMAYENGDNDLKSCSDDNKPALPPSSNDFDLDGLSVLDLLSVYSCLRSFSRSLFLSPFHLKALVAALRSKYANPLIDSIHFSLLQALRPHLQLLMEDGLLPASDCLRNLNWDLLDLVTWPLFLVEYLFFCGYAMRLDIKLAHLKLLDDEYYEQSTEMKLKILCYLCDDVVEVECLRSELNRRALATELTADPSYNMNSLRNKGYPAMYDGESSMAQGGIDDIADGNSDECCLCKMDGNLICCDGCPAAFHSRCVGVAKDLLPEGEWYCPECQVDEDGVVSFSMPFKGADILGRDSHGRLFSGCCGYLLVSDSCDSNALCHYYNKNDLNSVIKVLKSEPSPFDEIQNAISAYWKIPINDSYSNGQYKCDIYNIGEVIDETIQGKSLSFSTEEHDCENFVWMGGWNNAPVISGSKRCDIMDSIPQGSAISVHLEEIPSLPLTSDPVGVKVDATSCIHTSKLNGIRLSLDSAALFTGTVSVKPTDQAAGEEGSCRFPEWSCTSEKKKAGACQLQSDPFSYINYYRFGQVAAVMAEELLPKPSEINNKEFLKTDEAIKSDQLKAISKKFTQWCWYNYYNQMMDIQKEDCGWCFACKRSNDADCLFKTVDEKHLEGFKINLELSAHPKVGLHSGKNNKSHMVFVLHYILSIEDRVRSLLSGPWEKLHYSEQWRRAILKAYNNASLKFLLLSLESNLRRVALLPEWLKPVDSDHTVGSASLNLKGLLHPSSCCGKHANNVDMVGFTPGSTSSNFFWWRGGKLSRQLFCWKMLPRLLASKCGRQAGRKKVPNIFYHDGSEFAKRTKGIAWRVAVETSANVAQLIYLVRELDSNIKWAEISSTHLFPQCTNESKKIAKLFKQVVIRRKCVEGTEVKYLLDFGKRETIPTSVIKHGVLLEECLDKRKRFWLSETYVPLNLVIGYEEKKLSRLLKKKDCVQTCEKGSMSRVRKTKILKGFAYLFSRVKDSEKQRCGHCNKDVLVREAVNCQYCDGFFHRKHFRVPKGATVTTYTCFKCKEKEAANVKPVPHKIHGQERKASMTRKGNPVSMSKKSKAKLDSMDEKLNEDTVSLDKTSTENQHFMSKKIFLAKMSKENQLSMAKKSTETHLSRAKRSKKKGASIAIKCRKNPVRMARKKQNRISLGKRPKMNLKKRKNVVMKRKRKIVQKRGSNVHSIKANSLKSDSFISWCKKKRSIHHRSYWLNGLLWAKVPTNERGRTFREKKVLLPLQPSEDPSAQPMCCICHEDYNAGVTYIGCECCGDWFHGNAFGLELDSISNLAGFICPKCRMKSVPVCPFSKDASKCFMKTDEECNASTESMDVHHEKYKGKSQNGACQDFPSLFQIESHSELKRESVLSHCNDEIVLSSEMKLHQSSTVQSPEHEAANFALSNDEVLKIRLKSRNTEEGIKRTSTPPEELLSTLDLCSQHHIEDNVFSSTSG